MRTFGLLFLGAPTLVQAAGAVLSASGSGYTLTLDYLEAKQGVNKSAYRANGSTDLFTLVPDMASLTSVPLDENADPANTAVFSPGGAGYLLSLPRVDFNGNSYHASLSASNPARFAVDSSGVIVPGAVPGGVSVAAVDDQTVGSKTFGSSSKLELRWTAPAGVAVHSYRVQANETSGTGSASSIVSGGTSTILSGLKAATRYALNVTSCLDGACVNRAVSAAVFASTSNEYWQLQGNGNNTGGLSRIVSDGNVRISATRFGSDAGGGMANRIQLYYGPNGQTSRLQALTTAITTSDTSASSPASYLNFTGSGTATGLISPSTAATLVKTVATGQGVPLSAAMGGKVRLFFEAAGADNKTRIFALDSQDGYVGQDFNSGAAKTCSTAADYSSGGGCAPMLMVGVEGDGASANNKIANARQHKVGFPTLNDWRWDGAPGTFMVFTTDGVSGCSTSNMNHGYAVWDGGKWNVQYEANGCPKLFKSAQAAFPLHIGGVRYKLYYGDPAVTNGKLSGQLPFLGPKRLIYADGALTGQSWQVDFEDWENQDTARDVIFLWPNGEQLDDTAEGYIDDFHFLTPAASLDLQVMYLAITNGTEIPFAAAAVLLNP